MKCEVRSARGKVKTGMPISLWMMALTCVVGSSSPVGAEIKFEDVKGKADPLGKSELLSFRILFNNLSATGDLAFGSMMGLNPSVGVFYTREGRELAFSAYTHFGIATAIDQSVTPRVAIGESRAYLVEWGLDLNYIITNANQFFWSAGLAEHSHLGGIIVEQNAKRFSMVPFANLMGLNTKARFYPLQEFFVTGSLGFSFLPVFAKEYQGYSTGNPAPDPGSNPVDMANPFCFVFEFSGEYRPVAHFTFHGGLRYRTLTYKAPDPSNANLATNKSLSYFSPFFGVTLLY